jgi:hypothetical protein
MRKYLLTLKGKEISNISRKRIFQYLLSLPIIIPPITCILIFETKTKTGLYFVCLISALFLLFILSIAVSMINKRTRTINLFIVDKETYYFETFNCFFIPGKKVTVKKEDIHFRFSSFRYTEKINLQGWQLILNKKEYYLMKSFFDEDLEENLISGTSNGHHNTL